MHAIASRHGSDAAHWAEVPDVALESPNQVLCQTLEIGICGTDREIVAGRTPLAPPGRSQLILGHECLAQVVAIGENVQALNVGDLVTPLVRRPIGDKVDSPVRLDLRNWGSYVERGIVYADGFSAPFWLDEARHLVPLSPDLEPVAVLTEPQSVAEKAFRECLLLQSARLECDWSETQPRVLVLGLGPIAFAALLTGVGMGWRVTVMGRDEHSSFRAQLVSRLGGEYQQINPDIWHSTFDAPDAPYDFVVECTGSEQLLTSAVQLLAPRGASVWLAGSRQPQATQSELPQMMRLGVVRNHLHLGSVNAAPQDFHSALERLGQIQRDQPDDLKCLITKRVSPAESLGDFQRREPQGIKVVIDYR